MKIKQMIDIMFPKKNAAESIYHPLVTIWNTESKVIFTFRRAGHNVKVIGLAIETKNKITNQKELTHRDCFYFVPNEWGLFHVHKNDLLSKVRFSEILQYMQVEYGPELSNPRGFNKETRMSRVEIPRSLIELVHLAPLVPYPRKGIHLKYKTLANLVIFLEIKALGENQLPHMYRYHSGVPPLRDLPRFKQIPWSVLKDRCRFYAEDGRLKVYSKTLFKDDRWHVIDKGEMVTLKFWKKLLDEMKDAGDFLMEINRGIREHTNHMAKAGKEEARKKAENEMTKKCIESKVLYLSL